MRFAIQDSSTLPSRTRRVTRSPTKRPATIWPILRPAAICCAESGDVSSCGVRHRTYAKGSVRRNDTACTEAAEPHAPKPRHRCQGDDAATGTRRPQGATGTGLLRTLIADPAARHPALDSGARPAARPDRRDRHVGQGAHREDPSRTRRLGVTGGITLNRPVRSPGDVDMPANPAIQAVPGCLSALQAALADVVGCNRSSRLSWRPWRRSRRSHHPSW